MCSAVLWGEDGKGGRRWRIIASKNLERKEKKKQYAVCRGMILPIMKPPLTYFVSDMDMPDECLLSLRDRCGNWWK
jgi:hypothetical protein